MQWRLALARLHAQRSTVVVEDLETRQVIVSCTQMNRKEACRSVGSQERVVVVGQVLDDLIEAVLASDTH